MGGESISRVRVLASISFCALMVLGTLAILPSNAKAVQDENRTLYVGVAQDLPDLNIFNLASNAVAKTTILQWCFEGLAGIDQSMLPYPRLAESWQYNEQTLEVVVTLRQGVLFSDGTSMTADDVVFTYNSLRAGTVYSSALVNAFDQDLDGSLSYWEMDSAVVGIDDTKVLLRLAHPYGQFFSTTMCIPIIPKHVWIDHLDNYGIVDVLWSDLATTTGTGPFAYVSGVQDQYRVLQKYQGYWGKDTTTPSGSWLYPPNVDRLVFRIYWPIGNAIPALQSGEIDCIAWPLTQTSVSPLRSDPRLTVELMPANGYFYLAFNMKSDPFGSLPFRKAVSTLIDKDRIVNSYMAGYGVKGSSCEPPYWNGFFNSTVATYPYDSTGETASALLNDAGFADVNGDGWRELPDGRPMEKVTILAPLADYDTVRIRTAQALASEMRMTGINAEAAGIDFYTLVSRMESFDYQMLILGWSFDQTPVGNVFNVLGPKTSSNLYGFWSVDDPNPFFKDLKGVSTLADAETQALAKKVDELGQLAMSSSDVQSQMFYTRWAEGVIADALPVNVLYYRVIIEVHSTSWTGWVPFEGTVFNQFSLANLEWTDGLRGIIPANEGVNAGLSIAGNVQIGNTTSGYVMAIDNSGNPVPGAQVALSVEGLGGSGPTVAIESPSGYTDSEGVFPFQAAGLSAGYSKITATVFWGPSYSADSSVIRSVPRMQSTLAVSVTPDDPILMPGESTVVSIRVTDESGMPVQGALASLDQSIIGTGSVDAVEKTTDESGLAQITYTAPSAIAEKNQHLKASIIVSVAKDGYPVATTAVANLLIYNSSPPDWVMVKVVAVGTTALRQDANVTSVRVTAVDIDGNILKGRRLQISYTNEWMVVNPIHEVTIDRRGRSSFSVQLKNMDQSGALALNVADSSVTNSVAAKITLTYLGEVSPAEPMYGGYIVYSGVTQFLGPMSSITATAYVWDQMGVPADNVMASLILSGTPLGSLVWCDDVNWDSTYDYLGINVLTSADGQNIVTSGPMNTQFDFDNWQIWYDSGWIYWEWGMMTGVPITHGALSVVVYGTDVSFVDLVGSIHIVPDGMGWFNSTTLCYEIDGETLISSEYVIGRSYEVVAPTYSVDKPVLMAREQAFDTTQVRVWVNDQGGAPVEGAEVLVYQNSLSGNTNYIVYPNSYPRWSDPVPTDANGYAEVVVEAAQYNGDQTRSILTPEMYVKASMLGAISMFSQMQIVIQPQQLILTLSPILEAQELGSQMEVTARLTDWDGLAMSGATIDLSIGTLVETSQTRLTDPWGYASFPVETSGLQIEGAAAFLPVIVRAGAPAYEATVARMMVAAHNAAPVIDLYSPAQGEVLYSDVATVYGMAYDAGGLGEVTLTMDSWAPIPLLFTPGVQYCSFWHEFGNLWMGYHTMALTAIDTAGASAKVVRDFFVAVDTQPDVVVTKNPGNAAKSTVTWLFQATYNGELRTIISNMGLKTMDYSVFDLTLGKSIFTTHMKLTNPSGIYGLTPTSMTAGHVYSLTAIPTGANGKCAVVSSTYFVTSIPIG